LELKTQKMTNEEIKAKGMNPIIYRAIEQAGGFKLVMKEFGYQTRETVYRWAREKGTYIPSEHILDLCKMGGNKTDPVKILEAMKKRKDK
jgi:hypothetical protein